MTLPRAYARSALTAAAGALIAVNLALAVRADAAAPRASTWLTVTDVAVGLAFVAAAIVAVGSVPERWLVAAIGAGWLAGSWLPAARSVHQGLLLLALAAFPTGRLRAWPRWAVAAAGVPVALGAVPQVGVAVAFGIAAIVSLADQERGRTARWYPATAAAGAGAVLAGAAAWEQLRPGSFDPMQSLFAWELALTTLACAFPAATRRLGRDVSRLADQVIEAAPEGLVGLAGVLGTLLSDHSLRVRRTSGWADSDADHHGEAGMEPGRRLLSVSDGGPPLAVIDHAVGVLDDPATAEAVRNVVRLAVTNLALQEEQRARLTELRASRARLLAATDRVRQRAADQLHTEVRSRVAIVRHQVIAARDELRAVDRPAEGEAAAALDIVLEELGTVDRDITALIAGVPPADLRGGRLRDALESLSNSSPIPVAITMDGSMDGVPAASMQAGSALFYVCSEALTNAAKHSSASRVQIDVHQVNGQIHARVRDDGSGGADPDGSGLRGLADRVAACGGHLRVDSRPGSGTTVTAIIPVEI